MHAMHHTPMRAKPRLCAPSANAAHPPRSEPPLAREWCPWEDREPGFAKRSLLMCPDQAALRHELVSVAIEADPSVDDRVHAAGALSGKREICSTQQGDPRLQE